MKKKYLYGSILLGVLLISCQQEPRFRVGIIRSSINHLPLSYAFEQDLLDMDKFQLIEFSSGWELQEAMIGKQVELGIMPFTYVYNAVDKNFPLRTVSFFERETDCVIASPTITNLDGLNGKKIGLLRASSLDVLLSDLVESHSLAITRQYFRTPNEMIAAMRSGEVDAITLYVPLAQKLEPEFKVLHWFGADHPHHPCCNIVVNADLIDQKRKCLIREIYIALEQSVSSIDNRDQELMSFMMQRYGLNETQAIQALEHTYFIMGLDDEGKLFEEQMAKHLINSDYLTKRIPPNMIYWDPWD